MSRSRIATLTIAGIMALGSTACLESEDASGDVYEDDFILEGRGTVMGTITLSPEIAPLVDGHGTLCVGLYDAELTCPPTGDVEYRRHVGLFYVDTDLNGLGEVPFVIHNVLPGNYQLGSMFDADETGCYSLVSAGDAMAPDCLPFTVEANETVELETVFISFAMPH